VFSVSSDTNQVINNYALASGVISFKTSRTVDRKGDVIFQNWPTILLQSESFANNHRKMSTQYQPDDYDYLTTLTNSLTVVIQASIAPRRRLLSIKTDQILPVMWGRLSLISLIRTTGGIRIRRTRADLAELISTQGRQSVGCFIRCSAAVARGALRDVSLHTAGQLCRSSMWYLIKRVTQQKKTKKSRKQISR